MYKCFQIFGENFVYIKQTTILDNDCIGLEIDLSTTAHKHMNASDIET